MQKINPLWMSKKKKKILIVSATKKEILPLINYLKKNGTLLNINKNALVFKYSNIEIKLLITGIGICNTTFELGKIYNKKFDWVINAGLCGAFDKQLNIGSVIIVKEDIFSELGAESGSAFLKASEINLGTEKIIPQNFCVPKFFNHLIKVKAITVNTVHGSNKSISKIKKLFSPQIESMEGAAFYFACNHNKWKCIQLRCVSNYVEKRNVKNWNLPLSINNLNKLLIAYLDDEKTNN